MSEILNNILTWLTTSAYKVVIAFVVLFISFAIIGRIFKKLDKSIEKNSKLDKTLSKTLAYAGGIAARCLVVLALIGYLGIDTSGVSALIASLGVCIGLAVNGTLSNLAGGIMLLITRPFKDDDYIEAAGYAGTVEDIRIVTTRIRTVDNKIIYIPNGSLSTSSIINYSEEKLRRVDFVFSIAYSADFEKAKALIADVCAKHELVLKDPEPFIRVSAHNESSIDITTRVWVNNADYWTVNFDLLESVKKTFDENGIEIPFKQVDVHVKKED